MGRIFAGSMFSVNTVLWIEQSLLLLAFRLYWFWNTPCCKHWKRCQIVRGQWNKNKIKDFTGLGSSLLKSYLCSRRQIMIKAWYVHSCSYFFPTFKTFFQFSYFSWKFLLFLTFPTFCFWLIICYVQVLTPSYQDCIKIWRHLSGLC